jgi:hypothetical protein
MSEKTIFQFAAALLLFVACHRKTTEAFKLPPVRMESPYNMGIIRRGDTVQWVVSYKNIGKEDLRINYVHTPCGCTTAIPQTTNPVSPSDSSTINITYVPTGTGYIAENFFLYFHNYENPIHFKITAKAVK